MHSIYRSAKSSFTLFGRYQLKPNIYESAAAAQHIATNNRRLSVGLCASQDNEAIIAFGITTLSLWKWVQQGNVTIHA